jgi:hypothetical protein
VQGLPQVVN